MGVWVYCGQLSWTFPPWSYFALKERKYEHFLTEDHIFCLIFQKKFFQSCPVDHSQIFSSLSVGKKWCFLIFCESARGTANRGSQEASSYEGSAPTSRGRGGGAKLLASQVARHLSIAFYHLFLLLIKDFLPFPCVVSLIFKNLFWFSLSLIALGHRQRPMNAL